eukprot:scaffold27151_cov58-Cyclotella_meneghiniana.AAC.3
MPDLPPEELFKKVQTYQELKAEILEQMAEFIKIGLGIINSKRKDLGLSKMKLVRPSAQEKWPPTDRTGRWQIVLTVVSSAVYDSLLVDWLRLRTTPSAQEKWLPTDRDSHCRWQNSIQNPAQNQGKVVVVSWEGKLCNTALIIQRKHLM